MRRRTKIVATLGPATDEASVMREMLEAGVNVVRINFSHGSIEDHQRRVGLARSVAAELGREVGVLGDLQGPKIRIERFADGPIVLKNGAEFVLDASLARDDGDQDAVGITYKNLPNDVSVADVLLLSDGHIVLKVKEVKGGRILCTVTQGGRLTDNQGINRLGGGLSAGALTEKDREDLVAAADMEVDYLAISFPRGAEDVQKARRLLDKTGSRAGIVAKIERAEAVQNIESILEVAEVVMVARGDLGVEIGDAELPGVQKQIINLTRDKNRVVITATQMMESMIASPIPTRAEVLDVANAVLDGTDAVMLSAETATGAFPVKAIEAMDRVCRGAERQRVTQISHHRIDANFELVDEAIAMAAMYTANHLDVKAIVALTESGSTALWMSRIRSGTPIFALTPHKSTRRRVTLYRGVYPIHFAAVDTDPAAVAQQMIGMMRDRDIVKPGDWVIHTEGDASGVSGGTNTMKIIRA